MRGTTHPQSATSLPRAPRDDSSLRMRNYVITMSVRTTCFVLMVAVTPYGWYTWVFAIGAAILPYIAVVIANVGVTGKEAAAVDPGRALSAPPPAAAAPGPAAPVTPTVIRIQESRIGESRPPAPDAPPSTTAPDAPPPTSAPDAPPAGPGPGSPAPPPPPSDAKSG